MTDVLSDRRAAPRGMQQMLVASLAAHAVLFAGFLFAPGGWFDSQKAAPKTVMTITLGGGNEGPVNGGMTSVSARAVQVQTPLDEPKRPEPVRAPAAKVPEMTVPIPKKPPVKAPPPPKVAQAPDDAVGRTPTKGAETRVGTAFAETGARGQGFGLSTGGGQGSGSKLDVADFCCPDYIIQMVDRVRSTWVARAEVPGLTIVKFTIQRDGIITGAEVEKSSGYTALDIAALRAVIGTRQLPPLPTGYPNASLGVHLNFDYLR
ncbi:MAG: energy transducer TonB [Vicinamibacterales bacterium]